MRVSVSRSKVEVGARWEWDSHSTPTRTQLPLVLTLIPQTHSELAPTHPSDSNSHSSLLCCALVVSLMFTGAAARAQQPLYKNSKVPTAERVRDLLGRMTLEEKFWQLWMVPGEVDAGSRATYRHGVFGLQVRERDADS